MAIDVCYGQEIPASIVDKARYLRQRISNRYDFVEDRFVRKSGGIPKCVGYAGAISERVIGVSLITRSSSAANRTRTRSSECQKQVRAGLSLDYAHSA